MASTTNHMGIFKDSETVKKIVEENAKPQCSASWRTASYEPKDRPAFEAHRAKTEAVETLKEELEEILETIENLDESMVTMHRMISDSQEEVRDIKFRLNAMLRDEFISDKE